MKSFAPLAVVLAALVAFAASAEEKKPNPVQREMQLLEQALQDSVAAIAAGDVRSLPKKLHAVHTAAGDTGEALKSGAYKPPKNGDQVAALVALDEAFHAEMIRMVKAARKNDVPTTAKHFGALMQRCHGCHAQFRHPPALKK